MKNLPRAVRTFYIFVPVLLAALVAQTHAQPAFQPTGSLTAARYHHAASLLPNGKVLVAGGYNGSQLASAEIYDPATGIWTPTGSMAETRFVHTTTLLTNGLVLVVGGYGSGVYRASAELYNPATGTWTPTGSLSGPRNGHTATLLPNGKVLVAGGSAGPTTFASAELYDPAAGTWTPTGSLTTARTESTATLLTNGLVLIVGGRPVNPSASFASAEIFNPATGTWSVTGSLNAARSTHTATLLPNGMVLVASGYSNYATHALLTSAELFNPVTGTWSTSGSLNTARAFHSAALLPSGLVLVAGGADSSDVGLSSAEVFSSVTGAWTNTSNLQGARFTHTATRLNDGRVLIAGGQPSPNSPVASTELFTESAALATLTTGLMAYYPFNGNANDASGNGNNGTVLEAVLANDRFTQASRAYSFDGVNDQIEVAHSASLSPTNAVTVAAWIRPLANEDNKHCVSKGSHVNYFSRSYSLQGPWADGNWRAALSTPTGEVVVASSTAAALGAWSHVLMTYDGAVVKLYINGQLSGTQPATGLITQTSEGLFLGSHKFYAASDYWFNGGIDDVRIYNRALSAAEITKLHASEAVLPTITTQPAPISANVGGSATFSVTAASGSEPLSYQWLKNGLTVPGANAATLVFNTLQTNQAGNYTVAITNAAGSITSSVAALTVNQLSQTITFGALAGKRVDDGPFSLTATANSGLPVSFSSSVTSVATVSGNTATITGVGSTTITASQAGDAVYLPATSVPQTLVVSAPPSIGTPPAGQSFTLGSAVTLGVSAGGTGPLSYQWQFNGMNIAGATTATLGLSNLSATNAGAYRVVITNAVGTITSIPVDLHFFGDLKFIAATVLAGSIGQQYRVDYADVVTIGTTNWLVLTNITLPSSPFLVIDPASSGKTQRYYRAVPLP